MWRQIWIRTDTTDQSREPWRFWLTLSERFGFLCFVSMLWNNKVFCAFDGVFFSESRTFTTSEHLDWEQTADLNKRLYSKKSFISDSSQSSSHASAAETWVMLPSSCSGREEAIWAVQCKSQTNTGGHGGSSSLEELPHILNPLSRHFSCFGWSFREPGNGPPHSCREKTVFRFHETNFSETEWRRKPERLQILKTLDLTELKNRLNPLTTQKRSFFCGLLSFTEP